MVSLEPQREAIDIASGLFGACKERCRWLTALSQLFHSSFALHSRSVPHACIRRHRGKRFKIQAARAIYIYISMHVCFA